MERDERTRSISPAGIMATACKQRRPDATLEAPAVSVINKDQLAPRERRAGPCGVAERFAVPGKPGNTGVTTPISVQKLQTALHAKAKESPDFRFYAVYDKVYRKDVLAHAHERCEANGGAAGVDEQTFEDIERYGVERWLDELTQELKSRTYQPQPVRRVYIPKPDGGGDR
jgi:hypothetical protein